ASKWLFDSVIRSAMGSVASWGDAGADTRTGPITAGCEVDVATWARAAHPPHAAARERSAAAGRRWVLSTAVSLASAGMVVNNKSNRLSNWRPFVRISAPFLPGPAGLDEDLLRLTKIPCRRGHDSLLVDDDLPAGLHRRPDIVFTDEGGRDLGGRLRANTSRIGRGAGAPLFCGGGGSGPRRVGRGA